MRTSGNGILCKLSLLEKAERESVFRYEIRIACYTSKEHRALRRD